MNIFNIKSLILVLCLFTTCTLAEWKRCGLKYEITERCCQEATGTTNTHYCWGDMRYHCDVGPYAGNPWETFIDCCEDYNVPAETCP
jgi:hypothetical protein